MSVADIKIKYKILILTLNKLLCVDYFTTNSDGLLEVQKMIGRIIVYLCNISRIIHNFDRGDCTVTFQEKCYRTFIPPKVKLHYQYIDECDALITLVDDTQKEIDRYCEINKIE